MRRGCVLVRKCLDLRSVEISWDQLSCRFSPHFVTIVWEMPFVQ
jgi:hypothetical protein